MLLTWLSYAQMLVSVTDVLCRRAQTWQVLTIFDGNLTQTLLAQLNITWKEKQNLFNFTCSDVELGNAPSLVVNSQHHLLVPLQSGDFALFPPLNTGDHSFLQSIANWHAELVRLRSSHTVRGVINAWQWHVALFAQHHFNVTGNLI